VTPKYRTQDKRGREACSQALRGCNRPLWGICEVTDSEVWGRKKGAQEICGEEKRIWVGRIRAGAKMKIPYWCEGTRVCACCAPFSRYSAMPKEGSTDVSWHRYDVTESQQARPFEESKRGCATVHSGRGGCTELFVQN